jgi:hypothetical protein
MFFIIVLIGLAAAVVFLVIERQQRILQAQCLDNIRVLEKAKLRFGAEYGAKLGDAISQRVLESFIGPDTRRIACPCGGEYNINPVGEPVTCSAHSKPEEIQQAMRPEQREIAAIFNE